MIKVVSMNHHLLVVERKNHTLKEMMNAMLKSFGLLENMWGDDILTAF